MAERVLWARASRAQEKRNLFGRVSSRIFQSGQCLSMRLSERFEDSLGSAAPEDSEARGNRVLSCSGQPGARFACLPCEISELFSTS